MTSELSQPAGAVASAPPCAQEHGTAHVASVLLQIWQDILHLPSIDPADDFFELGGDSLGAIRMLERIGKAFGDELLEPDIIYTASNFQDLVEAIATALAERATVCTADRA